MTLLDNKILQPLLLLLLLPLLKLMSSLLFLLLIIILMFCFFFMTAVTGITVFKSVRDRQGVHRKEKEKSSQKGTSMYWLSKFDFW